MPVLQYDPVGQEEVVHSEGPAWALSEVPKKLLQGVAELDDDELDDELDDDESCRFA